MARKLRIQYPGAIYHVMNRGDRGELIFLDEVDRERFLETLQEACAKTGWQVQAYCLIPNHFHLVLETPQPNLATGMKWFLGTYSSRFSGRHNYFGHLFGGRYKALVVDGSTPGYLKTVCDYVHLNPVRARLLRSGEALRDYCWSSFPHYLKSPGRRPGWLRVGRLLGEHGIPKDSPVGRRIFEQRMEERRGKEEGPETWAPVRRSWCLGEEAFRKELLARVTERRGACHYLGESQEVELQKAERMVREQLTRRGWTEAELKHRTKSDRHKARIALRLRQQTTMTMEWISRRLHMGTVNTLKNALRLVKSRD